MSIESFLRWVMLAQANELSTARKISAGIIDFYFPGLGYIGGSCGCIFCATIVFSIRFIQIISTVRSKDFIHKTTHLVVNCLGSDSIIWIHFNIIVFFSNSNRTFIWESAWAERNEGITKIIQGSEVTEKWGYLLIMHSYKYQDWLHQVSYCCNDRAGWAPNMCWYYVSVSRNGHRTTFESQCTYF